MLDSSVSPKRGKNSIFGLVIGNDTGWQAMPLSNLNVNEVNYCNYSGITSIVCIFRLASSVHYSYYIYGINCWKFSWHLSSLKPFHDEKWFIRCLMSKVNLNKPSLWITKPAWIKNSFIFDVHELWFWVHSTYWTKHSVIETCNRELVF